MDLNDLLLKQEINPKTVIVFRHRPAALELRRILPWLAAERPDLFNAYQQTQSEKVEKAMLGAKFVASFIGNAPGKALFVGMYEIGATTPLTFDQYSKESAHLELKKFGMEGLSSDDARSSILWFDLKVTPFLAHWKGRLIVRWPPPERSWWRRAHQNDMAVDAVLEESALDLSIPEWNEIVVDWEELAILPPRWKAALSQWRGIYFIFDRAAGKGYVGSAYGADNLLGRWLSYAASGHGGNKLLKGRQPENFKFTILERVSPDLEADAVIRIENTWKERLHTRQPFGLNEN